MQWDASRHLIVCNLAGWAVLWHYKDLRQDDFHYVDVNSDKLLM